MGRALQLDPLVARMFGVIKDDFFDTTGGLLGTVRGANEIVADFEG